METSCENCGVTVINLINSLDYDTATGKKGINTIFVDKYEINSLFVSEKLALRMSSKITKPCLISNSS